MTTITPATEKKRSDLLLAIERLLAAEPCVQAVVAVGSVATDHARLDSDIDAVVFMDPIDPYVVPAESIWCPWDDTFHSIFTEDRRIQQEGIQLDFKLCDLRLWSDPSFVWPEPQRAGLAEGWTAFDRAGKIARLIAERTVYDDATRIAKLDQAVVSLDQHLKEGNPERNWDVLGPLMALDRLAAAYDDLAQALFAYNRRWRFWREREMSYLLRLSWLPHDFEQRALVALNAPSLDRDGFAARAGILREMFHELLAEFQSEGLYGDSPIKEAFMRSHKDEPGRSWDMDKWNKTRQAVKTSRAARRQPQTRG